MHSNPATHKYTIRTLAYTSKSMMKAFQSRWRPDGINRRPIETFSGCYLLHLEQGFILCSLHLVENVYDKTKAEIMGDMIR